MRNRSLIDPLSAIGALFCAVAVALGAYAAHAAGPAAQTRLQTAVLYLLLHGVALIAWRGSADRWPGTVVAGGLVLGTLLFSGSLIGAALWHWSTRLAPFGGSLLILSWLLAAVVLLRARR